MSAVDSAVKTTDFTNVTPREIDFVSRFATEFEALKEILSVSNPIRKPAGTVITTVTAVRDGDFSASPAEGAVIPYTNYNVVEAPVGTLTLEKYRKGVTAEAIEKYGYEVAVQKTDDQFLHDLQSKITTKLYTALNTFVSSSELKGETWQMAMAKAKAQVVEQFRLLEKSATGVVAWTNVNDFYEYEGAAAITVQTAFGLTYVENFMGFNRVFLTSGAEVAKGQIIATAIDNLDLYYIDASQTDFSRAGLNYTTDGEANLIGFHAEGNYGTAVSDAFAIMGITISPEYATAVIGVQIEAKVGE